MAVEARYGNGSWLRSFARRRVGHGVGTRTSGRRLGNGWPGRLAGSFIESAATMQRPVMGYGLRHEYGIFRQSIRKG
jgi:glucan phosphorylase